MPPSHNAWLNAEHIDDTRYPRRWQTDRQMIDVFAAHLPD